VVTGGGVGRGGGAGHGRGESGEGGIGSGAGGGGVGGLAESVGIVKELLTGRTTTFEDRHYQVRGHAVYPRPVQRPHPPILIGGHGRNLLSLAAREADIVGLVRLPHLGGGAGGDLPGLSPGAVDERVGLVRAAAGDRFAALELNVLLQRVVSTDDLRQGAEAWHARRPEVSVDDALRTPFLLFGSVERMVDELRARRERWGFSYFVTFEGGMDTLAPVVARLAGT